MLYLGTAEIEWPKGPWLFIGEKCDHAKVRVFDPLSHSFNPLKNIDKKTARQIARVPYFASPEGVNTLTVRNGRRALAHAVYKAERFDEVRVDSRIKGVNEEVEGILDDLLFTDVMRKVLCSDEEFGFEGHNRKVFARVDRAELGDEDALMLGLLLMLRYKGHVIVDDLGFYGLDSHAGLARQGKLTGWASTLGDIPPRLRREMLRGEKVATGVTYEDALELAERDCKFPPHTDGRDTFIKGVMA
jgi:hypothetical protein